MDLLFIVDTYFPYGVAISSRVRSFCKLFKEIGYNVHVIAQYTKQKDLILDRKYEFDGYTYQISCSGKTTSLKSFFADSNFINSIEKCLNSHTYDIVFSLSCSLYYKIIRKLTMERKIPYYVEQCEWQDTTNYRFGKLDFRYRMIDKLRSQGYRTSDGVICISSLLNQYYDAQGLATIRIPTILDVYKCNANLTLNIENRITLIYTGNPGKTKELLKPIIECLANNPDIKEKFVFHIYGPTRDNVIANIGDEKLLMQAGNSVIMHGFVPQEYINRIIANSHFQVFVRPIRKSSDAGFPTKLGESMTVGTPVIANNTGDICKYLRDGYNGYVLKGNDSQSIKDVLIKIMELSTKEYKRLRYNSRKTAECSFDYRNYCKVVKDLFEKSSLKESLKENNAK